MVRRFRRWTEIFFGVLVGVFPVEVRRVELLDLLVGSSADLAVGETAFPEEDLCDGAILEVAAEVGSGGTDFEDVIFVVHGRERLARLEFFAIEVEADSSFFISNDDGEMLFAVVDFGTVTHGADPTDVVVELPVFEIEGFTAFSPFSLGGGDGGESAAFCGGFETGHQGEGLVHGEVFSGERLEGEVAIGDKGLGDFDPFGSGVAEGGEVNEGG